MAAQHGLLDRSHKHLTEICAYSKHSTAPPPVE
jgi:hypothetical protein